MATPNTDSAPPVVSDENSSSDDPVVKRRAVAPERRQINYTSDWAKSIQHDKIQIAAKLRVAQMQVTNLQRVNSEQATLLQELASGTTESGEVNPTIKLLQEQVSELVRYLDKILVELTLNFAAN